MTGSDNSVLPLHLGDCGESQLGHPSSSSLVEAGEKLLPRSGSLSKGAFGSERELSTENVTPASSSTLFEPVRESQVLGEELSGCVLPPISLLSTPPLFRLPSGSIGAESLLRRLLFPLIGSSPTVACLKLMTISDRTR